MNKMKWLGQKIFFFSVIFTWTNAVLRRSETTVGQNLAGFWPKPHMLKSLQGVGCVMLLDGIIYGCLFDGLRFFLNMKVSQKTFRNKSSVWIFFYFTSTPGASKDDERSGRATTSACLTWISRPKQRCIAFAPIRQI